MSRELVNEVLDEVVPQILATLDDAGPELLAALSGALEQAENPAFYFALPIRYLTTNREAGEPADRLTTNTLRSVLRTATAWHYGAFVEELEQAEAPFWVAVRDAIEELRELLPEPTPGVHVVG